MNPATVKRPRPLSERATQIEAASRAFDSHVATMRSRLRTEAPTVGMHGAVGAADWDEVERISRATAAEFGPLPDLRRRS